LVELGAAQAPGDRLGFAAADVVVAQPLQKLDMATRHGPEPGESTVCDIPDNFNVRSACWSPLLTIMLVPLPRLLAVVRGGRIQRGRGGDRGVRVGQGPRRCETCRNADRCARKINPCNSEDTFPHGDPPAESRRPGGPGESHPRAPTDPGVTVSRHRALVLLVTRRTKPRASISSARTCGDTVRRSPASTRWLFSRPVIVCISCGSSAPGRH
jgi:hypothetical protein